MYDIEKVAEALLLEPEELRDIYQIFFTEAQDNLNKCQEAYSKGDWQTLKGRAHALKGSALNLRMERLSSLAKILEDCGQEKKGRLFETRFPDLKEELALRQKQIEYYYLRKGSLP